MAQSTASQMYTCALSGLSPVSDPVVTPSGYICSRKLLLTKLSENGGVDPFDDRHGASARPLDESRLIDLAVAPDGAAAPLPPKPARATSLPSLLALLREEFDAVLLELYDTRKALEETRRELSSALYQNDAAVRVVARVARERDEARRALEWWASEGGAAAAAAAVDVTVPAASNGNVDVNVKRAREAIESGKESENRENDDDGAADAPTKKAKTGPADDADAMIATWKSLSKLRKAQSKQHKRSDEQLRSYRSLLRSRWAELRKVNLHESRADAGVLCLARASSPTTTTAGEYLVSGGRDGRAVVYDVDRGVVLAALKGSSGEMTSVAGMVVAANDAASTSSTFLVVATGSDDGTVRLHSLPLLQGGKGDNDGNVDGPMPILMAEQKVSSSSSTSPVVSALLHPSSDERTARIVVSTRNGTIALLRCQIPETDPTATTMTTFETVFELTQETEEDVVLTSGALHPDGLIYAVGTEKGTIFIWDLKTRALAGTLETNDKQSVDCIAFSENGYHVATSSSAPSTTIQIWDLRKLKSIATIHPNGTDGGNDGREDENVDGDDDGDGPNSNVNANIGRITSVAFDPSGVFLAYSGEGGTKVCVVKDVDSVVCALISSTTGKRKSKKKEEPVVLRGGVVWGGDGTAGAETKVWCASGCDGERPLRIWGVAANE